MFARKGVVFQLYTQFTFSWVIILSQVPTVHAQNVSALEVNEIDDYQLSFWVETRILFCLVRHKDFNEFLSNPSTLAPPSKFRNLSSKCFLFVSVKRWVLNRNTVFTSVLSKILMPVVQVITQIKTFSKLLCRFLAIFLQVVVEFG